MNIDEITTQLQADRETIIERMESGRKQKASITEGLKADKLELERIDRMLRSTEARTRKTKTVTPVVQDGEHG